MRIAVVLLSVVVMLTYSCSTDVDLTAPYKDISIVYGLLDAKEDTQWVRINKAFLGDGDALLFAQIPDSLYYDSVFVYLLSYQNGNKIDSIPLKKGMNPFPKDPGLFANSLNILYFTDATISTNKFYKLFIQIPSKNKVVSSSTGLCRNLIMKYPQTPATIIGFEDPSGLNPNYTRTISWIKDDSTKAYQLALRFNYLEWVGNDTANKVLKSITNTFPLFKPDASNIFGNEVNFGIQKSTFYGFISTFIEKDPPGTPNNQIRARQFYSLDFIVYQAGQELYNYIAINAPSTSIVQKASDYTNIKNGLGLFSSRGKGSVLGVKINQQTLDSLRSGQFTGDLNFK